MDDYNKTDIEHINIKKKLIDTEIEKINKRIKSFTLFAWILVIIGFFVACYGIYEFFYSNLFEQKSLNLLGDFLSGTATSIWSLSGLLFVYVAFLGQRLQLLNQQLEIMHSQLEIKYTRIELEGQKIEMKEQNKNLKQQRFENTFFNLINNHQKIVEGLDIRKNNNNEIVATGRDCFKSFNNFFITETKKRIEFQPVIEAYTKFYYKHQSDLGHYFRNLFHIVNFVDTTKDVHFEEKIIYIQSIQVLLSNYELLLLFYYALSKLDNGSFKLLVEKYSLFQNLNTNELIDISHKKEYKEEAFTMRKF